MSGKIHRISKGKKPNAETQIVGGTKIPARSGEETKIVDQRVKQADTEIQDSKGDKIVVKTHTRTRPKGNS